MDVVSDMPEALRFLHSRSLRSETGRIQIEPQRRLHVVLPMELTAAITADFRAMVEEAWNGMAATGGPDGITINASGMTFLDSSGIGFLMALRKKALRLTEGIRCTGFRGNVRQTLALARVEGLFTDDATSTSETRTTPFSGKVTRAMRRFTPQKWGGMESVVFNLARTHIGHGMESPVFCTDMFAAPGREQLESAPIRRFPYVFP